MTTSSPNAFFEKPGANLPVAGVDTVELLQGQFAVQAAVKDLALAVGINGTHTTIQNNAVAGPATLAQGLITGSLDVYLLSTVTTPGTLTTRTAAQLFADQGAVAGASYALRIVNTGTSTFTLGAGTGVTLTGTMTVLTNAWRDFVVTFVSATAVTITAVGSGTV